MRAFISHRLLQPAAAFALAAGVQAGQEIAQPKSRILIPEDPPLGSLTLGGQFSEGVQSVYLDTLTALWHPGQAVLFYNGRSSYNDSHQYVYSPGLVGRYLVPGYDVILGANVYYDRIDSQLGNEFSSLGFGAEALTRWVDARFNYYLPATSDIYLGTTRRTTVGRTVSGPVRNGNLIQTTTTTRTRTQRFNNYEAELEGWNAELGFLIPGLDRYMETRVLGGYYHYNNPFAPDYEGFKARLETHVLPGVIADVEWWNDKYLNGGHWTAGIRAQVPFDFFNLFHGRNPFEGAGEAFHPRQREFRERLNDMVIRSHRVKTVASGPMLVSDKTTNNTQTTTIGTVASTTLDSVQLEGGTISTNGWTTVGSGGTLSLGNNNNSGSTTGGAVVVVNGNNSGGTLGTGVAITVGLVTNLSETTLTGTTLTKGGSGSLNLGSSNVYTVGTVNTVTNAGSGTVNLGVSQTLSSVSIGTGTVVTFGDGLPFSQVGGGLGSVTTGNSAINSTNAGSGGLTLTNLGNFTTSGTTINGVNANSGVFLLNGTQTYTPLP